ncbi:unnamed protein product [Allacma fusca]|uniref:Uncharacterized protein n=1 Tax=Allacma fusca TaxID=39272 RepID=A0A8J2P4Y3_9HEXA|nr:unnamed protein product [Allacma fusca]
MEIRDTGAAIPVNDIAPAEQVVEQMPLVPPEHYPGGASHVMSIQPVNTDPHPFEQATSKRVPGFDGDIFQIGRGDPDFDKRDIPPLSVWCLWVQRRAPRAIEQTTPAISPGIDCDIFQIGRGDLVEQNIGSLNQD